MARRVNHRQLVVSRRNQIAVVDGLPGDRELGVFAVPRTFEEAGVRVCGRERGGAAGVIAVAVRDEDAIEACAPRLELGVEVGQVLRLAHAGVDERRRSAGTGDEIRVVARSGHRSGIVGAEQD